MADITKVTDAPTVAFVSYDMRPVAVNMKKLKLQCQSVMEKWTANSISSKIPSSSVDIIDEERDDAYEMTCDDVLNFMTRIGEIIDWYEGNAAISQADRTNTIEKAVGRRIEIN